MTNANAYDKNFTLGADVELFIFPEPRVIGEGYAIPPSTLGLGDKDNKSALPGAKDSGYQVHQDNCCVEINVPPSTSGGDAERKFRNAFSLAKKLVQRKEGISKLVSFTGIPQQLIDKATFEGLHPFLLVPLSAAKIPKATLEGDPLLQVFGCSPELNVYTGKEVAPPEPKKLGEFRTAGGHLHLGLPNMPKEKDRADLVKLLDLFLMATNLLDPEYRNKYSAHFGVKQPTLRRRKYYGQAGSLRFTEYNDGKIPGVEYRTPGPEWFPTLSARIFNRIKTILQNFDYLRQTYLKHEDSLEVVQDVINNYKRTDEQVDIITQLQRITLFNKEGHPDATESYDVDDFVEPPPEPRQEGQPRRVGEAELRAIWDRQDMHFRRR